MLAPAGVSPVLAPTGVPGVCVSHAAPRSSTSVTRIAFMRAGNLNTRKGLPVVPRQSVRLTIIHADARSATPSVRSRTDSAATQAAVIALSGGGPLRSSAERNSRTDLIRAALGACVARGDSATVLSSARAPASRAGVLVVEGPGRPPQLHPGGRPLAIR